MVPGVLFKSIRWVEAGWFGPLARDLMASVPGRVIDFPSDLMELARSVFFCLSCRSLHASDRASEENGGSLVF